MTDLASRCEAASGADREQAMTLREKIAAASAKAAQGVWEERYQKGTGISAMKATTGTGTVEWPACDWLPEDAEFVALLVNAYRAGKLLVIEDEHEAVNNLGFSIWHQLGQIEENARAGQLTQDEVRTIATAALAALKGEGVQMQKEGMLPDE